MYFIATGLTRLLMKIEHFLKSQMISSDWSGGTTTQLAIFPPDASYQKRNFFFRLSSAKVESPSSTFTPLPNISRGIMILEGELELSHKNHYSKTLKQFDIDYFEGDWETTSLGRVTDFNLMTSPNTKGTLEHLLIPENRLMNHDFFGSNNVLAFYSYKGSLAFTLDNKKIIAQQGDLVLFFKEESNENPILKAYDNCHVIMAKIKIP